MTTAARGTTALPAGLIAAGGCVDALDRRREADLRRGGDWRVVAFRASS